MSVTDIRSVYTRLPTSTPLSVYNQTIEQPSYKAEKGADGECVYEVNSNTKRKGGQLDILLQCYRFAIYKSMVGNR